MRYVIVLALGLLTASCASRPVIVATPAACSKLVPPALWAPTPGAPLPADDSKEESDVFGVRQTGQLDKSNTDKASIHHIVTTCEGIMAESVKSRSFWSFLPGVD